MEVIMKFIKTYKIFENNNSNLEFELKKYGIENYTINSDGSIDVDDYVTISYYNLTQIPFKFRKVNNFFCNNNHLTNLEGCPLEVSSNFNCSNNQLISLEHCPLEIECGFYCYVNQLTNLEGCPIKIGENFDCSQNELTSLKGCPTEIGEDFDCSRNQLTSLEYCPLEIGEDFNCSHNKLIMLDCSSYIKGDIYCWGMFKQEPEFFGDCEGEIRWK